MRSSRSGKAWLVVAVALALVACTAAQRRERTDITVSGGQHQSTWTATSCEGELLGASRHRESAGAVGVATQLANGMLAEGEVSVASSRVETAMGSSTDRVGQRYTMVGTRARFGWLGKLAGVELGGTFAFTANDVMPFPYASVQVGHLDFVWVEGRIGQNNLLLDSNLVGLFAHVRFGEAGGASIGLSSAARLMSTGEADRPARFVYSDPDDAIQVGGWADLGAVQVKGSVRVGSQDGGAALQISLPLRIGPDPKPRGLPAAHSPASY